MKSKGILSASICCNGKQSTRRANAKKKGRDHRSTAASVQNENTNPQMNMSKKDMERDMDCFERSLLQSSEEIKKGKVSSTSDCIQDSLYVQYKKCTQRFKDTLQSMVPVDIFKCDNVSALVKAAEFVAGMIG
jgi:hypothetical protein